VSTQFGWVRSDKTLIMREVESSTMKDIESATVSSTPHGTADLTGLNLSLEPFRSPAWVPMVGFALGILLQVTVLSITIMIIAPLGESQYRTRYENKTNATFIVDIQPRINILAIACSIVWSIIGMAMIPLLRHVIMAYIEKTRIMVPSNHHQQHRIVVFPPSSSSSLSFTLNTDTTINKFMFQLECQLLCGMVSSICCVWIVLDMLLLRFSLCPVIVLALVLLCMLLHMSPWSIGQKN
jgi:hypothetical protein